MVWFYLLWMRLKEFGKKPFNPTMVWFYPFSAFLIVPLMQAFNPTMVWFYHTTLSETTFWLKKLSIPLWSDFIFSGNMVVRWNWKTFNPTMVWFYPKPEGAGSLVINTFNPTMVWFYRRFDKLIAVAKVALSIPLWSDFIPQYAQSSSFWVVILSIPLWSDFILLVPHDKMTDIVNILSIPLWSDFIAETMKNIAFFVNLSIPLWSDFIYSLPSWNDSFLMPFQSHYGLILSNHHSFISLQWI